LGLTKGVNKGIVKDVHKKRDSIKEPINKVTTSSVEYVHEKRDHAGLDDKIK
ncbi:16041_t:CDS:1, partial [Racocetra fulgida]